MNFNFKNADEPHEQVLAFIQGFLLTAVGGGAVYSVGSKLMNAFNRNFGYDDFSRETFQQSLDKLVKDGHAKVKNGKITFTEAGKAAASDIDKVMGIGDYKKTPVKPARSTAARSNAPSRLSIPQKATPTPTTTTTTPSNPLGNYKMVPKSVGGAMRMVKHVAKPVAAVGLAMDAYDNATGLVSSLQRGEGYAAIPGLIRDAFSAGKKEQVSPSQTRGMPKASQQLSNIPPAEGPQWNPAYRQQVSEFQEVEPQPAPTNPLQIQQTQPQVQPAPLTGANDPRNKPYLDARNALGPNATRADIQAVEDIGMSIWESIYGKK